MPALTGSIFSKLHMQTKESSMPPTRSEEKRTVAAKKLRLFSNIIAVMIR